MPKVEIFEDVGDAPIFIGDFDFLPRPGEIISKDAGGYFDYYNVIEAWYRGNGSDGRFQACLRVKLDD